MVAYYAVHRSNFSNISRNTLVGGMINQLVNNLINQLNQLVAGTEY